MKESIQKSTHGDGRELSDLVAGSATFPCGKCLVAIGEMEKALFLKGDLWEELCSMTSECVMIPPGRPTPEKWKEMLLESDCDLLIVGWSSLAIPEDFPLEDHPLQYVCSLVGGVQTKVSKSLLERGLKYTNWGGSISRTIAESTLMLTLMALRRASYWHEVIHHDNGWRRFPDDAVELSLFERRVGIHGFGRIARELVELLRPFRVEIATYCPSVSDDLLAEYEVSRTDSLEALFEENEILIELAGLTEETRGSVTEDILRRIRDGGVFVNVGRAAVVEEAALIRIAEEGRIRIALDVFHREPLEEDSLFRQLGDITVMPHQSGPTLDRMRDAGEFALANIRRYLSNEPLDALVNPFLYEQMT